MNSRYCFMCLKEGEKRERRREKGLDEKIHEEVGDYCSMMLTTRKSHSGAIRNIMTMMTPSDLFICQSFMKFVDSTRSDSSKKNTIDEKLSVRESASALGYLWFFGSPRRWRTQWKGRSKSCWAWIIYWNLSAVDLTLDGVAEGNINQELKVRIEFWRHEHVPCGAMIIVEWCELHEIRLLLYAISLLRVHPKKKYLYLFENKHLHAFIIVKTNYNFFSSLLILSS